MQFSQDGPLYIEGSKVMILKNVHFLLLKIDFVLENSANSNEMPLFAKVTI